LNGKKGYDGLSGHRPGLIRSNALTAHMLDFVCQKLKPVDSISKGGVNLSFRSRFAHTERVCAWGLRIMEAEGGDLGILSVASIFHDVGYMSVGHGHAEKSVQVFRDYMKRFDGGAGCVDNYARKDSDSAGSNIDFIFDAAVRSAISSKKSINRICNVIASHSSKDVSGVEIDLETKILMDADMLDEAGAIAVLWDCFMETTVPGYDFESAYRRILGQYDELGPKAESFKTNEGKRRFLEMRRYVGEFIDGLKTELNC